MAMASRLPPTSILNLPIPARNLPNHPHRIPLCSVPPPLDLHANSSINSTTISRSKGRSSPPALGAVQEEVVQSPSSERTGNSEASPSSSSKLVLVIGGTGGVGIPQVGVTHVICCSGTTAFPSKRWEGDNTPERVDWEGVRNLISALPSSLKRIVLVSSVGVTKSNELPWRPGRLTDGPYTSYDLNTLLKATAGKRRAVLLGQGDKLVGEVSRHVVAEACIQALDIECTEGQIFEVNSVEGEGPGSDQQKWRELFKAARAQ
ncbi:hypothetical protein C1H46_012761 [Malus baccata]|uniref:NAD(P)-binding domain-containing protein n=1 Tax=Malus baccata TaxID=106549 RepID=A0A540MS65_MALBA|nr:hypothetical protein C1H46_012761 [Malus baccata]